MTTILEVLARLVPFAIGWFLIGAVLAWRTRLLAPERRGGGSPYRVPFVSAGQESTTDAREAWQAGVAAERERVLVIVATARDACEYSGEKRVADAIRKGIEGGAP